MDVSKSLDIDSEDDLRLAKAFKFITLLIRLLVLIVIKLSRMWLDGRVVMQRPAKP